MNKPLKHPSTSNASQLHIYILSDGTGETAEQIIHAALVQYQNADDVVITRFKNVRTEQEISIIFDMARSQPTLILFTVVSESIRRFIVEESKHSKVPSIDLFGKLFDWLSFFLQKSKIEKPGLLHGLSESYFQRIEAIEYTVKQDDGKHPKLLDQADIILLGLSRTSKTPLSVYLSYKGWKVANIPIIKEVPLPKEVESISPRKFVGLTIHPQALLKIRKERVKKLGFGDSYADPASIEEEMKYAADIFRGKKCPVFDVTEKALEETASEIEDYIMNISVL